VGKEVSYCRVCGDRLGVGEALESQVYVHDGRRYCAACRPARATAKIPLPDRRTSSTKLRSQPPAPRGRETTRIRKRGGWRLALAAASVTALAVGIALAAGGSSPAARPAPAAAGAAPSQAPPAPNAAPGPSIDELIGRVREIRQSDLMFERRGEVRRLLAEASGRAGARLEEVDLLAAGYDRAFEEAAARLADFTRSEAARAAAKGKFAEAIERLDGYPASFGASKAAATLRLLREDYERRRSIPPAAPPSAPRRLVGAPAWSVG
jgi:hypothetical protein